MTLLACSLTTCRSTAPFGEIRQKEQEEDKNTDAPIPLQSLLFAFTGGGEHLQEREITLRKREKEREKYLNSPWKGTNLPYST